MSYTTQRKVKVVGSNPTAPTMKSEKEIINNLVEKASNQNDIKKAVIEAVFIMALLAEDDSAESLYNVADWSDLSKESEEIMFGKQVADYDGYLPGEEDYDDTREGEYLYLYPAATKVLIAAVKQDIVKKFSSEWYNIYR